MRVFGIGDLHLSAAVDKPMDIFGPQWRDHDRRIAENWRRTVGPDDVVLIPGDLSWAMSLEEARPDLEFIGELPGSKYFIRGNHDYWCSGPSKVRAALGPGLHYIRFDAAVHGAAVDGRVGICGVRGWVPQWHPDYDPSEDEKHWSRAVLRLGLSLGALEELDWDVAVAMFHFPPRSAERDSELTRMIRRCGVRHCIYGHLHGQDARDAFEGDVDGVTYRCVSADRVDFTPRELFALEG